MGNCACPEYCGYLDHKDTLCKKCSKMGKRIDLDKNHIVIEGENTYSIITPEGSVELSDSLFWRMIAEFGNALLHGKRKVRNGV